MAEVHLDHEIGAAGEEVRAGVLGQDGDWIRFGFPDSPGVVDVRETMSERRGAWGVGSVHHLAWRVDDETHQLAMRERVEALGGTLTISSSPGKGTLVEASVPRCTSDETEGRMETAVPILHSSRGGRPSMLGS